MSSASLRILDPLAIISDGFYALLVLAIAGTFSVAYSVSPLEFWLPCYVVSLTFGVAFLLRRRLSYFSVTSLFVVLTLIGMTFPVVPFLFFGLKHLDLRESIFINSLGLLFFVGVAELLIPRLPLRSNAENFLGGLDWDRFLAINLRIFFVSLPGVFAAMIGSGGFQAYFGLQEGGFDRIASLKGFGPLMIFSYLNALTATIGAVLLFFNGRKIGALVLLASMLIVNGFTFGRGNMILVFVVFLLFFGLRFGVTVKGITIAFAAGFLIVLTKILRGGGGDHDYSALLMFFLQFAGDFDTINNVSHLLNYLNTHSYPGMYHIWSNVLTYLPRAIFPNKPQFIGGLHLDDLVFPGVYLGAGGGTGFSFGVVGTLFAVSGLGSLAIGMGLLAATLALFERQFKLWTLNPRPTATVVAYLILLGQVVIIYRDGFYAFFNLAFYFMCYAGAFVFLSLRRSQ